MVNGHKVLVVVPAKDEEATIGEVLEQIKAEYPWMDILVVDDGSNDSTAELAKDADQVRGSRELGKYEWKEPLHLKIPRWVCSTLVSLKLRQIITDATSGF